MRRSLAQAAVGKRFRRPPICAELADLLRLYLDETGRQLGEAGAGDRVAAIGARSPWPAPRGLLIPAVGTAGSPPSRARLLRWGYSGSCWSVTLVFVVVGPGLGLVLVGGVGTETGLGVWK